MELATAARLAHSLMKGHSGEVNFYFEVDTATNAAVLADALRCEGCAVLVDSTDVRLNIYLPIGAAERNKEARRLSVR